MSDDKPTRKLTREEAAKIERMAKGNPTPETLPDGGWALRWIAKRNRNRETVLALLLGIVLGIMIGLLWWWALDR